jgi:hypothetical protein
MGFQGRSHTLMQMREKYTDTIELARWLESLENKNPKRAAALVTELCFSEVLLPAIAPSLGLTGVTSGWFFVPAGGEKKIRHWFKVFESVPVLNTTEQKFIAGLSARDSAHRFFAIIAKLEPKTVPGCRGSVPGITVEVSEFTKGGSECSCDTSLAKAYAEDLSGNMRLAEERFGRIFGAAHQHVLAPWLNDTDPETLRSLVIGRCILNFGFSAPRDLDALALDADGAPVLLEFKRKDPAGGSWSANDRDGLKHTLAAFEIDARVSLLPKNPAVGKVIFKREAESRGFTWCRYPAYGLDLSHFDTVCMCEERDMAYIYLVWDCKTERLDKSEDAVQVFERIIGRNLQPLRWPDLKWKCITRADASGITYTGGSDSGSYKTGVRVQVTFDASSFTPVSVPGAFKAANAGVPADDASVADGSGRVHNASS